MTLFFEVSSLKIEIVISFFSRALSRSYGVQFQCGAVLVSSCGLSVTKLLDLIMILSQSDVNHVNELSDMTD